MNKLKISIITLGLVVAGFASAALVSYISNAPVASVNVDSPIEMSIYEGVFNPNNWTTGQYSINLASNGGSSMPFTTIAKNNANNRVGGYYVTVIEAEDSGDKITGKEFSSIMFYKNKGTNAQNGEMLDRLCVIEGDGSLTKLADYIAAGRSNPKLALLFDVDGNSTQHNSAGDPESTGMCSPLTPYLDNETRSFFHINAGEYEKWTFTPTWDTGVKGHFKISAQYVIDLATYASDAYSN